MCEEALGAGVQGQPWLHDTYAKKTRTRTGEVAQPLKALLTTKTRKPDVAHTL